MKLGESQDVRQHCCGVGGVGTDGPGPRAAWGEAWGGRLSRVPRTLAALPHLSAQSALIFLHPTFWHPLTCFSPCQASLMVLPLQGAREVGGPDRKVREEEGECA